MINQQPTPKPRVLTVSQLNMYVKSIIDGDYRLRDIHITGEISNLKDHYRSGHIYMTLKDSSSAISAVMFAGKARYLKFRLADGMKVICRGRPSVYEVNGQYQFYIDDIQPDGIGALHLAFEQLKNKLTAEGLFAQEHKQKIPRYPKTIGIITSPTGAVLQDIRNVIARRYPYVKLVVCPVLVQGETSSQQIIQTLKTVNRHNAVDTIIIARGGGSVEDLWAFNDEMLAREIYNSKIPVISAVGHETDYTICDFVADLRAPTPSAAAELAVPDVRDVYRMLEQTRHYLSKVMDDNFHRFYRQFGNFYSTIRYCGPTGANSRIYKKVFSLQNRCKKAVENTLAERETNVKKMGAKLEELNPVSMLNRGYVVAYKDGKALTSVKEVKNGDDFTVYLADGEILTTAKSVTEKPLV